MSISEKDLSLNDLYVGQKFTSGSYAFSVEEIKRYAQQFDPQPFHLDEKAALLSPFGGLVASGWHAASVCMRLIVESIHLECGLIGLGGTLSWLKPVRPGDHLCVTSEIVRITPSRSKPDQAVVELNCNAVNGSGEVVITFLSKLMVFTSTQKA